MNDFKNVKEIAEQMLELSVSLLRLVDQNETERRQYFEELKKCRESRNTISGDGGAEQKRGNRIKQQIGI